MEKYRIPQNTSITFLSNQTKSIENPSYSEFFNPLPNIILRCFIESNLDRANYSEQYLSKSFDPRFKWELHSILIHDNTTLLF